MAYSEDLRERVLNFVVRGGSKAEAARVFETHLRAVFLWVGQGLAHQRGQPGPTGSRKFSRDELAAVLEKRPDQLLKGLAAHFRVSQNTIAHALKCMGISRKKNTAVRAGLRASASAKTATLSKTPLLGRTRKMAAGLRR
jgi:putative transposase